MFPLPTRHPRCLPSLLPPSPLPLSLQLAFICFVYPCLIISYAGQAAFMLNNYTWYPFWQSVPNVQGVEWFVFALAVLASIVAGQAAITGMFSLVRQVSTGDECK